MAARCSGVSPRLLTLSTEEDEEEADDGVFLCALFGTEPGRGDTSDAPFGEVGRGEEQSEASGATANVSWHCRCNIQTYWRSEGSVNTRLS